jgi:3-(methylthio)propanoyl-CoA dehydrogenase
LASLPGYGEELTPDLVDAVLEEAAKFCAERAAAAEPHRRRGRLQLRERRRAHAGRASRNLRPVPRGGWNGLSLNPEYGGQGLPKVGKLRR